MKKFHGVEFPNPTNLKNSGPNSFFFFSLTLILLISVPLLLRQFWPDSDISNLIKGTNSGKKCNIFAGKWVLAHTEVSNYTKKTCPLLPDQQNCVGLGRKNTEYMNWRWKPNECELPYFDAAHFLELVRGKSLVFLGDSVGLNQMHSLVCLLSRVAIADDVTYQYQSNKGWFKYYFYADYNFKMGNFWSPYLVKSLEVDPNGFNRDSLMNIYLDEADEEWVGQIASFDYVIISAGQWFTRPLYFYENGKLIGCHRCPENHIKVVRRYYAYRMAFRTTFMTLSNLKNYTGATFLRTFTTDHFENGKWWSGGDCLRTKPFTSKEMRAEDIEYYSIQMEEVRRAEEEWRRRGLKFEVINTTKLMWLRPDAHPSHFGKSPHKNTTVNDCVHWCLPGPIDTWNEFLLYLMRRVS